MVLETSLSGPWSDFGISSWLGTCTHHVWQVPHPSPQDTGLGPLIAHGEQGKLMAGELALIAREGGGRKMKAPLDGLDLAPGGGD